MRSWSSLSLLLFQLEKLLKAQSCLPRNTLTGPYTRTVYNFQRQWNTGKKFKISIVLSRIKVNLRNMDSYTKLITRVLPHKCVKAAKSSLLVPVHQPSPQRGWMDAGNLFCLLKWVTIVGRVKHLGCWLSVGSTFMLINTRSKSHTWHVQWGEDQQVW